jgi:hypothetical protein
VIAVVAVSVLVAVGALGLVWHRSTHGVLVTRARLHGEETFRGVLFDSDRDALVLRSAVAIGFGGDGNVAPVQGELVLLRSTVAYIQAT